MSVSLLAAACGDDDDTSAATDDTTEDTTAGGDAGASNGIAEAQAIVDEYMEWNPGEAAGVVPGPLSEAPPTGKTIYWMEVSLAINKAIGDGIIEAAESIGWTVERIDMGTSADTYQAAWHRALAEKPDMIISSGVDKVQIEEQLAEANRLGIPYLVANSMDTPGDGNIGVVGTLADKEKLGALDAAWVAADSGGTAKIAFFNLSGFQVIVKKQEAFAKELERLCPDCEADYQIVAPTDIGKAAPGKIVAYLQAHPDVDYLVYGTGGIATGVAQALREAGLIDQIKAVTSAGTAPVWEEIESGGPLVVDIPNNDQFQGWQIIDRAARYFVGDETTGEGFHETDGKGAALRFATADTIEDPAQPFSGPDGFRDQFKELWNLR